MIYITLSGNVSPSWREILKASTFFSLESKLKWNDGCSTKFWLDHWVGDATLASTFHDSFLLAMDPSTSMNTQTWLIDGIMIWAPQFRRRPYLHLSNDLNNLLVLLEPITLSTSSPNVRHWKLKDDGLFTVNSLYKSLAGFHNETNCFQRL